MERMTHKRVNGIKTGYWSPATKEELVQRLAEYENTGLEPQEIAPAIEKAAKMAECIAGGIVARAFAELYPGIDYHAQFVPGLCDESGNRAFGLTIFPDDGSTPIVCISAEAPIGAAPELLAHELAHVATPEDRDHGEAWKAAEKAIGDKYDELLNAMIPDDDPGVLVPHEVGDGDLLLMPTRAHIPDPQRGDWKPATCPICGAECWETEIHRQALAAEPGLRAVCTDCGLRGAAGVGLVDTSSKKEEKDHE